MSEERTPEEKARSKRVHAWVMIVLGAIMAVCALAAGLIAMHPGAFPAWMTGAWRGRRERASFRRPAAPGVAFEDWSPGILERARREERLILLHLTAFWSRDGRVMEETTYADPEVAAWVRERTIAVRVDADAHPELLARYGVGVWPSTVLLQADGRALAAGGYLTPKLFLPWAKLIDRGARLSPQTSLELARRAEDMRARAARPDPSDAEWTAAAARREDPVWGGIYGGRGEAGSGGGGFEKTLADQARFIRHSRDRGAVRRALAFVEKFMALPDGYAASVRGEVQIPDGRVMEGFAYFALDDAGRRAIGLPAVDRRFFTAPNRAMAQALLAASDASSAQKRRAREILRATDHQ